ncbi:hypothetical protein THIOKS12940015 [Thiocapsa sp. KS1]|nr:hypothetical protein THIOKS12940015 [Thiocapsa sp. KS1]
MDGIRKTCAVLALIRFTSHPPASQQTRFESLTIFASNRVGRKAVGMLEAVDLGQTSLNLGRGLNDGQHARHGRFGRSDRLAVGQGRSTSA